MKYYRLAINRLKRSKKHRNMQKSYQKKTRRNRNEELNGIRKTQEVEYTEIIEEFKEAMQHENSFTDVNCKTVDALADCIMDYEIEDEQLKKDIEAAVKINV